MLPEYTFTPTTGWTLLPAEQGWLASARPFMAPLATEDNPGDVLFARGYKILADSPHGRCGVGTFAVWQAQRRPLGWPRYCIEIQQLDDACVVWIATLPDLWEFLRLYGGIGTAMQAQDTEDVDDDAEDEEGMPRCPDCGMPMTLAPDPLWDRVEEDGPYDDA